MIYFTNASGGIALCVPERVYQGSPEGSKLYLVGPYAENATVTARFTLPDGRISAPCLLERESAVEGYTDAEGNALAGWSALLPACVTEKFGIVRVQFEITAGGTATTAAAHFTVERGTPPALPPQPQVDVYAQILAALTGVRGDLANGYFAARSLYKWNALYEYGAGELVYFAEEGESGAFVRSLAAGNKGNPPYANGVLDAAHWEEAVPFDAVLEAEQNAAASAAESAASAAAAQGAASAAEDSEQAAESSKTAAAQSASSADTAKQNAQTYAQNANTSAGEAAASAELARQYAEIGIQPNTDYTALEELPVPGSTKFIYLIPAPGSGDSDAYNEYIWVPAKQGYEFIGSTKVDLSGYAQIDGTYAGMTVGNAQNAENAESAGKALQDGNGNTIAEYYVDKTNAQTITGAKTFQNAVQNSKPLVIESGGVTTKIGDKNGAWTHITTTAATNGFGFEGHINAMAGYSIYSADNGEVAYKQTAGGGFEAGQNASATGAAAVAIGSGATASAAAAVQIGSGTNAAAYSVQFANYPLLDLNTGTIYAERLLSLFPVGSYYITESATTPASLFGGEWVRVSGYFLYGAVLQDVVGNTGGESVHILTVNEIPSHYHNENYNVFAVSAGGNTGTNNIPNASNNGNCSMVRESAYTTTATGGGAAHNNMPPYRQVNMWRRSA